MALQNTTNFTMRRCIWSLILLLLWLDSAQLMILPGQLDPNKPTPEELMERDVLGEPITDAEMVASTFNIEPAVPPRDQPDPIFIASLFEGDIYIKNPEQLQVLLEAPINDTIPDFGTRNAIIQPSQKWPGGKVPYVISSSFSKNNRLTIAKAFENIQKLTCIKFIPRTYERDYIHILKGDGCSSSVGKIGGKQHVSIGSGCEYEGIVMHELYHALGFWHEQSRADRDNYITIQWHNIINGLAYNFKKKSWGEIQNLGEKYDLGSIMHYGKSAFAKNYGDFTIIPNQQVEIGQRRALSRTDIAKLKKLYNCDDTSTSVTSRPIPPGGCADNNKLCQQWANIGECTKNYRWMHINCQKSCRICTTTPVTTRRPVPTCKDDNTLCAYWSRKAECTNNPGFMLATCRKSCGVCGTAPTTTTTTTRRPCPSDKHQHCNFWAKRGECQNNAGWMLANCKKSCNNC